MLVEVGFEWADDRAKSGGVLRGNRCREDEHR
jgi:hypothetical protein